MEVTKNNIDKIFQLIGDIRNYLLRNGINNDYLLINEYLRNIELELCNANHKKNIMSKLYTEQIEILDNLKELWVNAPCLRFMQLITNIFPKDKNYDVFYLEDRKFIKLMENFKKKIKDDNFDELCTGEDLIQEMNIDTMKKTIIEDDKDNGVENPDIFTIIDTKPENPQYKIPSKESIGKGNMFIEIHVDFLEHIRNCMANQKFIDNRPNKMSDQKTIDDCYIQLNEMVSKYIKRDHDC